MAIWEFSIEEKYGSDDNFDIIINLIKEIWKFGEEEYCCGRRFRF
jgi:hypothetical protein